MAANLLFGGFGALGCELTGDGIRVNINRAGETFGVVHGRVVGEGERVALVLDVALEVDLLSVDAAGDLHSLVGHFATAGNLVVGLGKGAVLVALVSFDAVVKRPLASEVQ